MRKNVIFSDNTQGITVWLIGYTCILCSSYDIQQFKLAAPAITKPETYQFESSLRLTILYRWSDDGASARVRISLTPSEVIDDIIVMAAFQQIPLWYAPTYLAYQGLKEMVDMLHTTFPNAFRQWNVLISKKNATEFVPIDPVENK